MFREFMPAQFFWLVDCAMVLAQNLNEGHPKLNASGV